MLAHLKLSYAGFVTLTCAALAAKVLCLPLLGGLCQRWGAHRTLCLSGVVIAGVPALWIFDGGFLYLLVLQVFAGAVWAAFELAMLLLFFERIPREQRLGLLTIFNVGSAAAIALGAVVGGAVLSAFHACREGYHVLFMLSAVARFAPLLLLVRMPRLTVRSWKIATRSLTVRPSMGTIERPVLASLLNTETASPGPHGSPLDDPRSRPAPVGHGTPIPAAEVFSAADA